MTNTGVRPKKIPAIKVNGNFKIELIKNPFVVIGPHFNRVYFACNDWFLIYCYSVPLNQTNYPEVWPLVTFAGDLYTSQHVFSYTVKKWNLFLDKRIW
jgi:hypothetical protein